eukprot:5535090-Amphidinium_carterae.6
MNGSWENVAASMDLEEDAILAELPEPAVDVGHLDSLSSTIAGSSWAAVACNIDPTESEVEVVEEAIPEVDTLLAQQKRKRGRPQKKLGGDRLHEGLANIAMPFAGASGASTSALASVSSMSRKPLSGLAAALLVPEGTVPREPKLSTYIVASTHGYQPLSSCSQCLLTCVERSLALKIDEDDYLTVHDSFVENGAGFLNKSMAVRAQELQIPRATLQNKLVCLASAYAVWSRLERSLVLSYLQSSSVELELLVIGLDEGVACEHNAAAQAFMVTNTSASSKLLQCRQVGAIVVKLGPKLFTIYADIPSQLQVMETNNDAILQECLSRRSISSPSTDAFKLQSRVVSRDQAAYNKLCEAATPLMRSSGH